MKKALLILLYLTIHLNVALSQGYQNPVITGFHPDPSVCRVGDDYYMVNSSMEYFPAVPVWHSKDLINWQLIGHALNRESQVNLKNVACSDGIYAPTIRFHDGIFYMVTTLVSHGSYKNFFVTTKDPAGKWSEPVLIDQNGIDPTLFWDDDGRCYFVSNRGMTFKTERGLYISELDIKTGKRFTDPKMVWKGTGGSYPEGPHLYKKDGYYYLLDAEGGTAFGHMVCISRSKSIWGPYENCPHNPILSNRYTYASYTNIQGTGHGDLVQAHDGTWWMVHLGFRLNVPGIHVLGRETCLAPVEWDTEGWPVVNKTGTICENMSVPTLPLKTWPSKPIRNDFKDTNSLLDWIYLRNPVTEDYSLTERKGFLRLKGSSLNLYDLESPTFIGHRQEHFDLKVTTMLDFNPKTINEEAGICLLMTNLHYYRFYVKKRGNSRVLVVSYSLDLLKNAIAEIPLNPGPVQLRIIADKKIYKFAYAQGNDAFKEIGSLNTYFLGTEVTGGYDGVIIGLYATGNGKQSSSPADFNWFDYEPLN